MMCVRVRRGLTVMLLVRGCRSLAELGYTHVGLDGGWNYVR